MAEGRWGSVEAMCAAADRAIARVDAEGERGALRLSIEEIVALASVAALSGATARVREMGEGEGA